MTERTEPFWETIARLEAENAALQKDKIQLAERARMMEDKLATIQDVMKGWPTFEHPLRLGRGLNSLSAQRERANAMSQLGGFAGAAGLVWPSQ